jgi:hypothetical protein
MRANLGYNLWIGDFVLGLDSHDTWTQLCPHEPLIKLTFGLARPEEEYVLSISHGRDYGVVVLIPFPRQRPLASVIGRNLACPALLFIRCLRCHGVDGRGGSATRSAPGVSSAAVIE